MNVTNDYEPPAWLQRKDRRVRMCNALAVAASIHGAAARKSVTAESTAAELFQLRGRGDLVDGVLTLDGGSVVDIASIMRELHEAREYLKSVGAIEGDERGSPNSPCRDSPGDCRACVPVAGDGPMAQPQDRPFPECNAGRRSA